MSGWKAVVESFNPLIVQGREPSCGKTAAAQVGIGFPNGECYIFHVDNGKAYEVQQKLLEWMRAHLSDCGVAFKFDAHEKRLF